MRILRHLEEDQVVHWKNYIFINPSHNYEKLHAMNSVEALADNYQRAAQAIRQADGLLIAAGAGMGVDSGLPDFRGKNGFWKAYPALGKVNIDFHRIASPEAFMKMPERAWGFYGHRLKLYRDTVPHDGFRLLREMGATLPLGAFVYTSNVDGQFQKAGFSENNMCELHGSIHYLQCLSNCNQRWSADEFHPEVRGGCGSVPIGFPIAALPALS